MYFQILCHNSSSFCRFSYFSFCYKKVVRNVVLCLFNYRKAFVKFNRQALFCQFHTWGIPMHHWCLQILWKDAEKKIFGDAVFLVFATPWRIFQFCSFCIVSYSLLCWMRFQDSHVLLRVLIVVSTCQVTQAC